MEMFQFLSSIMARMIAFIDAPVLVWVGPATGSAV
jgi:hypothetical protein